MSANAIGFQGGHPEDRASRGLAAVERLFSPEFRNRLDAIVTFHTLSQEIMEKIVDKFMAEVDAQLAARNVRLELASSARSWLARKGFDPAFGARPLDRLVQTEIKDVLADEILFGQLSQGGVAHISLHENTLTFSFTPRHQA